MNEGDRTCSEPLAPAYAGLGSLLPQMGRLKEEGKPPLEGEPLASRQ